MGRRKRKISPAKIGEVLSHAIHMAEELFAEIPKSGAAKKKWVVDFANDHLDLPWLTERQEEKVLSVLVDVLAALVLKRL